MSNQDIQKQKASVRREDEIDLLDLAKTLWNGRKTVLKWIVIFLVAGLLIALLSPKEYTSTTSIVPQTSQTGDKLGGLSSLAAMAGFNLDTDMGDNVLNPLVYPQIVGSTPFQLELMNSKFDFSESAQPISIFDYYTTLKKNSTGALVKKYTVGLPALILSSLKGEPKMPKASGENGPLALTKDQEDVRKFIEQKVTLNIDNKQGFLTISAAFSEPLVAAEMAETAQNLLQKYIIQYKIKKATDQLNFIEQRYKEKKEEFEKAQEKLAIFRDQNKNVTSAVARTQEDRLQSEYSIAMNVYSEITKQLEQAKIKVKEETPVFSVLEPATVPNEKSKPKRLLIIIIWTLLGAIIGTGIVFGRTVAGAIKEQWNKTEQEFI